jgi:NAD(P)-dependent dehydrogenase (short-subunit alcohol dehydrogenase family)
MWAMLSCRSTSSEAMAANPKIDHWQGRVVWIVGASSGIGRATASRLHALGARVVVSARNAAALDAFVATHKGSQAIAVDVGDRAAMASAAQQVLAIGARIDLAMYCAGHYRPMHASGFDLNEMLLHMQVNYGGALHLLDALLPVLAAQRFGHVSLVASVAGYRGLPNAMAYGPSKAALQHLADTLYLDLNPQGIGVSVVNPGFVATPLTAGNGFAMPALLTPDQAAQFIVRGWGAGDFDIHFPKRFTLWLKLLRLLPHGLYVAAVRRTTHA